MNSGDCYEQWIRWICTPPKPSRADQQAFRKLQCRVEGRTFSILSDYRGGELYICTIDLRPDLFERGEWAEILLRQIAPSSARFFYPIENGRLI